MAEPVTIAIVTANQRRHSWFVNELASDPGIEVLGVVSESKREIPKGDTEEEHRLVTAHLAERDEAEQRYFGDAPEFDELGMPIHRVAWGQSNDQSVADWVAKSSPDYLILFGSSIITEPLLVDFDERTINIHLGLSPYYRGTASNFWPLVNGEPECVGATTHLATLSVDAGPIIKQVRPSIEVGDGPHDIGCKALMAGAGAMREAVVRYAAGDASLVPQRSGGKLYKGVDFHPGAVAEMRKRLADGMIEEYVAHKAERDAAYPIVE